jgi:hypothetical protein
MLTSFLAGAIAIAHWAVGLFFFRFWHRTRDRLFLAFAVSFWLLSAEHCLRLTLPAAQDNSTFIYGFRLVAFILIIGAVIDKNRS